MAPHESSHYRRIIVTVVESFVYLYDSPRRLVFLVYREYERMSKLENCPRLSIEVSPTSFQTETLTLTLTFSIYENNGHELYKQKVKVKGRSVQTLEWKWTDAYRRRRRLHYLSCRANAVVNERLNVY